MTSSHVVPSSVPSTFLRCTAILFSLSLFVNPSQAQSTDATALQQSLDVGLSFEADRDWIQAIQHYEAEIRRFPENADLRRRWLISRLHYDVIRRTNDSAIARMIQNVTESQALELYSEVLARLDMSYVDHLDMTEVVRGGTAYLEVALTEQQFLDKYIPQANRDQVESFRTSIHRVTLAKNIGNRFDARATVSEAARIAEQKIGLSRVATITQFVLGAIGLLDPYSSFLSPDELNEVESQIEGNFVGLGIALQPHSVPLRILNVISGGPAEESGLKVGDEILAIGNIHCVDVGPERAADLLRGPEHSHVRLAIRSTDGSERDMVIVRRRVEVPSVEDVQLVEPNAGVAYLKINSFQKTTVQEIDDALWKLQRQGMRSLIIDLRGNPGGWLDASIAVADRFLPKGRIVSTRGKNGIENQNYDATNSGTWSMPLTLLIDQESASASEILAGAIRDNQRGELIGETTYGKGSVQGLFHTNTLQSGIRLTVSKFYSPSGRAISEKGVKPTLPFEVPKQEHFVAKVANENPQSRQKQDPILQLAIRRAVSRKAGLDERFSRN